jgi:hypothetical protein
LRHSASTVSRMSPRIPGTAFEVDGSRAPVFAEHPRPLRPEVVPFRPCLDHARPVSVSHVARLPTPS